MLPLIILSTVVLIMDKIEAIVLAIAGPCKSTSNPLFNNPWHLPVQKYILFGAMNKRPLRLLMILMRGHWF